MNIKDYYKKKFINDFWGDKPLLEIGSQHKLLELEDKSVQALFIDGLLNQSLEYEDVLRLAKQKVISGGTLFVFAWSIAPSLNGELSFWGFTLASAKFIFGKYFNQESFEVAGFGNVLVGRVLLSGGEAENLSQKELDFFDPYYPVFLGIKVINN